MMVRGSKTHVFDHSFYCSASPKALLD